MPRLIYVVVSLSALLLNACSPISQPPSSPLPQSGNQQSAWIAKDLGLKQCEQLSAQDALDRTQQLLRRNQINIFAAYCADDGMMRVQLCGAPQGKLGLYKIKHAELAQAEALGFKPVQAREYQPIKCS